QVADLLEQLLARRVRRRRRRRRIRLLALVLALERDDLFPERPLVPAERGHERLLVEVARQALLEDRQERRDVEALGEHLAERLAQLRWQPLIKRARAALPRNTNLLQLLTRPPDPPGLLDALFL